MSRFCIDTSAWVAYFEDAPQAEAVETIITSPKNEILSSIITVAEIVSVFNRRDRDPREAVGSVLSFSTLVNLDVSVVLDAGEVHARQRKKDKTFGMVDALVLASARKAGATLVTTDSHFKGMKDVVLLT